jgi:hypothetical protein
MLGAPTSRRPLGGHPGGEQEADKMAMIAFYAGLIIGIFVGCLLVSLFSFFLAGDDRSFPGPSAPG